jgi:Protein of unknown function (DUF2478)
MKIGYVMSPGKGDLDMILHGFAHALLEAGTTVAGIVQTNTDCGPDKPCDMDVEVLPTGPILRISQDLGPGSRGCRLDAAVLEQAAGLVDVSLHDGADLLVINKFGKQEADGRGFRPLIGAALSEGIPVIVGLNALNLPHFEAFTEGMGTPVAPDRAVLMAWFLG